MDHLIQSQAVNILHVINFLGKPKAILIRLLKLLLIYLQYSLEQVLYCLRAIKNE